MKNTVLKFVTFVLLAIGLFGTVVFAEEVMESFDVYENGNLNNQDGWSDSWNSLLVQDKFTFSGARAIQNQDNFGAIGYMELPKEFHKHGFISTKIYINKNNFSDDQQILGLFKGLGEDYIALFRFSNNYNDYNNTMTLSVAGSTDTIPIGEITQGEWHKISVAWREVDFKIRVRVDNSEWTPWFDSRTAWEENDSLGIRIMLPPKDIYGDFFIDDLKYFLGYEGPYYDPILLVENIESITDEIEESQTTTVEDIKTNISQEEIVPSVESSVIDIITEKILDIIGVDVTPENTIIPVEVVETVPNEEIPEFQSVTGDINSDAKTTTTF